MSSIARKNVITTANNQFPEPSATLLVARIQASQGGDLFMVEVPVDGELKSVLAVMPSKYMNLVWVKRGDLVMIELNEVALGAKVSFHIAYILVDSQLKHIVSKGLMPPEFMDAKLEKYAKADLKDVDVGSRIITHNDNMDSDDEFDLPANPNHQRRPFEDSSSSEDEDDE